MREDLTAAVIAGGAGRRMGMDKRAMLVEGVPLLSRAVAVVSKIATEVLVATTRTRPLPVRLPDVRVIYDRVHHGGPLAGIEVALAEATHELVLIVAGDMPWIQEPLLAVYRPSARRLVTGLVDGGEHRVGRLLDLMQVVGIREDEWRRVDPEGRSLVNINWPDDIA